MNKKIGLVLVLMIVGISTYFLQFFVSPENYSRSLMIIFGIIVAGIFRGKIWPKPNGNN